MGGDEDVEIVEPYEIKFCDLKLLSSTNSEDYYSSSSSQSSSSSPPEEEEPLRLESIVRSLMENLGPTGPGLVTVTGAPHAPRLRRILLPLARRLALLDTDLQKATLKEHNLGSDVPLKNPDRIVSSFAMQLKYLQGDNSNSNEKSHKFEENEIEEQRDLKILSKSFKELGFCMMEMGLFLARICDRALGGLDLEQSLLESCTAKGRLIHYHSYSDNFILKESAKKLQSTKRRVTQPLIKNGMTSNGNDSDMWQQWHYDYGIFTILTSPMFMLPYHKQETEIDGYFCEQESPSPSGHTFLKIFNKSKNRVQMVKTDPDSFIVQVGEAAEILSKGKLRANLHSVSRPEKNEELSRETFVVFLQPRWDKTFNVSYYSNKSFQSDGQEGNCLLNQELHEIVPPLSLRLKNGMTFAEFSQETTKQYYGGRGLQAKR